MSWLIIRRVRDGQVSVTLFFTQLQSRETAAATKVAIVGLRFQLLG